MAEQLPPPPVPADADLTHFDDMPLEVRRLRDSGIAGTADAEAFRCAVLSWCAAWHQIPAGSLPADDADLCRLVGLGRDLKTWKRIKANATRGWELRADGRLYHPVLSEKVMDRWNSTRLHRWSKECDRLRKENKARGDRQEAPLPLPEKPAPIPFVWRPDAARISAGTSAGFPAETAKIPPEKRLKGREGKGREGNREEEPHPAAASPPASASGTAAAAPEVVIPMPAPDVGNPRLDDQLEIPPRLDRRPATQAAMSDRALVDEAYQLWLPVAFELGISDVGHLNRDRRDALSARLAEVGGIEGWRVFLEKIREAEFLREPDGRPKFWVGLSKLLQPEHFSKVLEGRYAERHRAERPDERSVTAGLAGLAEAGSG